MSDDDHSIRSRRRWLLRYSLRSLLALVALLAIMLAFSVSRFARERAAVERLLAQRATIVYYDRAYGRVHPGRTLGAWIREFAGWRWPAEVHLEGRSVTYATLHDDILPLRTLNALSLTEASVAPGALSQLHSLAELNYVALRGDARNDSIISALAQTTRIDFQYVLLQEAIDHLADLHQIPLEINTTARGVFHCVDWKAPVTASSTNKTLGDVLDDLLAPQRLVWLVANGKLMITVPENREAARVEIEVLRAKLPQVKELVID